VQKNQGNSVILVFGGVRSGKSRYAQQLTEHSSRVTFVATAERRDTRLHNDRRRAHLRAGLDPWASTPILQPQTFCFFTSPRVSLQIASGDI
jgi:hypothetical protein